MPGTKNVSKYAELIDLNVNDKLELIEILWESIRSHPDAIPIPAWHLEELEKREAADNQGLVQWFSWEEVKRSLREGHD
jgi:putative addiction module component (TIGR02574 family)